MGKITAIYYVEESSPHNMYVLGIGEFDIYPADIIKIFKEEQQKQNYPEPSSDIVFIYLADHRLFDSFTEIVSI